MSAWPAIADDLHRALQRAGHPDHDITATLAALHPVVAAVERAGTRVDSDIAWALLACQVDKLRRRAQITRAREAS